MRTSNLRMLYIMQTLRVSCVCSISILYSQCVVVDFVLLVPIDACITMQPSCTLEGYNILLSDKVRCRSMSYSQLPSYGVGNKTLSRIWDIPCKRVG